MTPSSMHAAAVCGARRRLPAATMLLLALAIAGAVAAGAQDPTAGPGASVPSPWTVEDLVLAETASQLRLSPDGRRLAWVKSTADRDKDARVTNLMLTTLETKKTIELTRGSDRNVMPRWSPNGERIAFLSTRDRKRPKDQANANAAEMQLWMIEAAGGEAWPITDATRGIEAFDWQDNETIVFSAEEDPSLYEQEAERKKDKSRVVDDEVHTAPVRLFSLRVADRKVGRLTTNTDWIDDWELSPDGGKVLARHDRSLRYEWDQATRPVFVLHDLSAGTAREVLQEPRGVPMQLRWLADGSGVLAATPHTTHPQFVVAHDVRMYLLDAARGTTSPVALDWPRGLGGSFEVVADGFVALLADGAYNRLAHYGRTGSAWTRRMVSGGHAAHIEDFAVSRDGRTIAYVHSTASKPPQVFAARLADGALADGAQLTDLNTRYKARKLARTEIVRWSGANGDEVEGLLFYPHDYRAGKRYPLVTAPHGGPLAADMDLWGDGISYPNNLFAQRGAFVLQPNYHGSSNYGLEFAESICCGKYYELPVTDIETGVDALIARGLVDPDRIGTMGWSNGSILSTGVMLANPARYKTAAVGAGDVEWISDWANVDFGHAFDAYYFGAGLLENPQRYIELSPLFRMDRIQTPTLIFFGTEDRNVPTDQGWTHFRALQHLGKVPVKFVLFPGEPHGLRKLTHQTRKLEEEMAWFDLHFFRTASGGDEAVKDGSPLAQALRRTSVETVGAHYGTTAGGEVLVPETVERQVGTGRLAVGRFEVTRAQFAAFDPTYVVAPGTGNHPANGISYDRAKAYAAWLSRQTGATWRLPRESEAATLYTPSAAENTLDHWAGYTPNYDDAQKLAKKARELGQGAPLLKPVGSFTGAGHEREELVFDLGGNVSEWIEGADGAPKAVGGSADRPADPKTPPAPKGRATASTAAPEYIGFRVVRE